MLTTKVPYNTERDFTFLAMLARVPSALVTSNTSGYNSVKEVIDKARAAPGTLHYGHLGQGMLVHLVAELFKREAKLDITAVPFKGGAAAARATIGNQVPFTWIDVSAGWNQISGGLLKTLAVTGARRSPVLPNVPTLAESGLPNAVMEADYGVIAPAALPADVQARISAALTAAMEAPAVREATRRWVPPWSRRARASTATWCWPTSRNGVRSSGSRRSPSSSRRWV
jgi:tripartite-type tricarboxylate transporter receptor subunit TctC